MGTQDGLHKVCSSPLFFSKSILIAYYHSSDGSIHIDMLYLCLLSKPHIMVAGMTLSTVKAASLAQFSLLDSVSSLLAEATTGPKLSAPSLQKFSSKIPPGVGTTPEFYINPW
jgi:hypothetical protein